MTYALDSAKNELNLQSTKTTYSTHFNSCTFADRNTDYNNTFFQVSNGLTTGLGIVFNTNVATTAADFLTWLTTHNVDCYYLLRTPEEIKITDQNLINQLNALKNDSQSYYDITNINVATQNAQPTIEAGAYEKI